MARALVVVLLGCLPVTALADARALESIDQVHAACEGAREQTHARLFEIEVQPGWRLLRDEDGALAVDTGRNFRALDGHVSVLVPREEPALAFEADRRQAGLEAEGTRLRVGFFLAFDDRQRQPCLVRNRFAVTIVRADVAYVEIVDAQGARLARAETDRLRAWNDDRAALAIEGSGPRGAVGAARFTNGAAPPESWQTALGGASTREHIARCHAEGVSRGAPADGQVVVRLNVETRSGRIRRADVALSSLGDEEEAQCIARALGSSTTLGPGPGGWSADVVDLAVPVRLVND